MTTTAPSPAHAFAPKVLMGRRASFGAQIRPHRWRAGVAAVGAGPDHFEGEAPVALVDADAHQEAFGDGALFTDRRFLARGSGALVSIPYDALEDAWSSTGVVVDDIQVRALGRVFTLSSVPEAQSIASFLKAMAQLHPGQRLSPPRPLPAPSADDPTAGEAARGAIWSGDVRILPLVGMAIEGSRRGSFPAAIAADHVARAMLFDRTLINGRGAREGWWTSALGAADTIYAFSRMLGPPVSSHQDGRARALDFRLTSRGSATGAAASTAVGLLALGVFGVGWVSRPGEVSIEVRVRVSPGVASTGFSLSRGKDSLSLPSPGLVASVFETLARIEGRMLLLRAAFGWDVPSDQLDAIPMQTVFERVAATIGPLEIRIFYPR
jgi:hypothetical protein